MWTRAPPKSEQHPNTDTSNWVQNTLNPQTSTNEFDIDAEGIGELLQVFPPPVKLETRLKLNFQSLNSCLQIQKGPIKNLSTRNI